MSVRWDISKIENHDELWVERDGSKYLDALTESFVWASLAIGLGKGWSLDEEYAPEFFARLKVYEALNGPLTIGPEAKPVTIEDVRRRIGLHVNVSPVSRAAFIKNVVARELDDHKARYERAAKREEAQA